MRLLAGIAKPSMGEHIENMNTKHSVKLCYTKEELLKQIQSNSYECVMVQQELFQNELPWQWMSTVREHFSGDIWIALGEEDSIYREIIRRVSLDLQISLIPSPYTERELLEAIQQRIYKEPAKPNKVEGKIITFSSAKSGDGATTLAISTAISLAKYSEQKIGLLDLNLWSPEIADQLSLSKEKGLPVIQADSASQTLDSFVLEKACETLKHLDNLYILSGINRREWADKITLDEIDFLLETARQTFDVVVVDVHTFPNNAATIQSMKKADDRYIVVQPNVLSYQSSWHDWYYNVWEHMDFGEKDFSAIVNRSTNVLTLQIEKSMGSKIIAKIRNIPRGEGIKSVNQGTPIYFNQSDVIDPFRDDIHTLASEIAKKHDIEWDMPEERRKKKLFFL